MFPAVATDHLRWLLTLSVLIRLLVAVLVITSSTWLTLFDSSPRLIDDNDDASVFLTSLLRWDVFHFARVAANGHVYEHDWAFFPGVPLIMRWSGTLLSALGLSNPGWPSLLAGGAFVCALLDLDTTRTLYALSLHHLHSPSAAFLTVALSLLASSTPALRFTPYSEPFFTYFSYRGMLACVRLQWLRASVFFAIASAFRSNGVFLCGFIVWGMLVVPLLSARGDTVSRSGRSRSLLYQLVMQRVLYCAVLVALSLIPFLYHNYKAYTLFCRRDRPRPEWCDSSTFPSIYTYVQHKYWNVGFLRYWTLSNIPNFLLALPVLLSVFAFCAFYLSYIPSILPSLFRQRRFREDTTPVPASLFLDVSVLPHVLHALVLALLLTFNAHVQIALRTLPSLPLMHWAAACLLVERPALGRVWVAWSVMWSVTSCVLWAVFLPPA